MLLGKILLGATVGLAASVAFGLVLFTRTMQRNHADRTPPSIDTPKEG